MVPDAVKNRAKDGPIKWPALNITLFSGLTLSLGAILTRWHEAFEALFGYKPQENPAPAAAIFIGLVIAIALIVAADLLTRGIASSRVGDSATLPEGTSATLIKDGTDESGYTAAAIRITAGGSEVLVLKEGKDPAWYALGAKSGEAKLGGS